MVVKLDSLGSSSSFSLASSSSNEDLIKSYAQVILHIERQHFLYAEVLAQKIADTVLKNKALSVLKMAKLKDPLSYFTDHSLGGYPAASRKASTQHATATGDAKITNDEGSILDIYHSVLNVIVSVSTPSSQTLKNRAANKTLEPNSETKKQLSEKSAPYPNNSDIRNRFLGVHFY